MIKNILINFPTNIGDTILALPTLDRVRANYPGSKITAIASPKTKNFLLKHIFIDEVIVFDKSWRVRQKRKFAFSLRRKFDLLVDLKNSFLPLVVSTKIRTPVIRKFPKNLHLKDRFLWLVKDFTDKNKNVKGGFEITQKEKEKWDKLNIETAIFLACSSLSQNKMCDRANLKLIVEKITRSNETVVIIGLDKDFDFYKEILSLEGVINLLGKTKIYEVFYLLKQYAKAMLTVDSSILHIASYLDIPTIAIFGTDNIDAFGPYASDKIVLKGQRAPYQPNSYIKIKPENVVKAVKEYAS